MNIRETGGPNDLPSQLAETTSLPFVDVAESSVLLPDRNISSDTIGTVDDLDTTLVDGGLFFSHLKLCDSSFTQI